jgi:hypothetical protein
MRNAIVCSLVLGLSCIACGAFAETQQLNLTGYAVVTKMPEEIALPNGKKVMANGQNHASIVNDKTGEVTSQWCTAEAYPDAAGATTNQAGYCTIFYDGGDILWISFTGASDQTGSWSVIGGMGKYAGATGSGTYKTVSQRSDGYAWTLKSTGTIVTK